MTSKIYTKVGDQGSTKQVTGKMVPKYDLQIETLGQLDELESWLGVVCANLSSTTKRLAPEIQSLQAKIYQVQADIVVKRSHQITSQDTVVLEERIDDLNAQVPPIKAFILPGGQVSGADLQYARTLARKAERTASKLNAKQQPLAPEVLQYLNRLSDYLFMLARYANLLDGYQDVLAKKKPTKNKKV
ncbi:cobalamin adenosyltransferase CobO [Ligilactobacillus salitolerans]|uniref:Corrinoid adenosyltransferase n=1 Tax=Ligilactobacillus salitolerans TaxID=1808352 RepID=A0A401IQV3_9LACO|nr:cob(I)yrinic acid a,c-diamide adenosyltransferase [Ligilactobacillus salitolerans]GBG93874.1 cobalamin adenosyltransferase CobO [Ligilactobacillus salitolerans]